MHIPYSDASIPSNARARTHHTTIFSGLVFVWYDSEGNPPTWQINRLPDLDDAGRNPGMVYHRMKQSRYNMHIAEMAENSPDY